MKMLWIFLRCFNAVHTSVQEHRNEIRESSIAFLSVMTSAWFYWILFVFFTFFLTIPDSYIDILFRVSGIALIPSLFAASQAWYRTPQITVSTLPAVHVESTDEEFVI